VIPSPNLGLRPMLRYLSLLALAASLAPHLVAAPPANSPISVLAKPSEPASQSLSLSDYQTRLQSLDQLVVSCQHAPANCKSDQVGSDIKLNLPSGSRQIRFAWLRQLLDTAAKPQTKDKATAPPASKPPSPKSEFHPPTLAEQLEDAHLRLAAEMNSAAILSNQSRNPATGNSPSNAAASARQTLARILAAKEYNAAVAPPSLWGRILEKVGGWLRRFFERLQQAGYRSKWFGLAAEIGFGVLICAALAWFLIHLERQGRFQATSFGFEPSSSSPSARDWQLWLEDARKSAAQGAWRDAIHSLYWANISRLESSGLWPADRARTPREYLALLPQASNQRSGLATLTRSFERTWYAGRPAQESDFRSAEQAVSQLGAQAARLETKPEAKSNNKPGPEAQ